MTNPRMAYHNGRIIDEQEAKLSIYDSALMFGDMVFEMTRSFNHLQFCLKEHLERLFKSIRYLRIPLEMTIDDMEEACEQVIAANPFPDNDEHRLMINVTRGVLGIYQEVRGVREGPNVIISDFPLRWTTAGMGKFYDTGVNCVVPSQRTIPASLLEPKVKNRSRIHYLMANIEASLFKGEVWPILLDPNGYIAEGPGYNFFVVKNGSLYTPHGRNVLRGISRKWVLDNWDLAFEDNIELYDVYDADEAFVTATPFCMLPVVSMNGIKIGTGEPGPIFQRLLNYWSADVQMDIRGQIQAWDNGAVDGPSPYKFK